MLTSVTNRLFSTAKSYNVRQKAQTHPSQRGALSARLNPVNKQASCRHIKPPSPRIDHNQWRCLLIDEQHAAITADLSKIGQIEGFQIIPTDTSFIRDVGVYLHDGTFLVNTPHMTTNVINQAKPIFKHWNKGAYRQSTHLDFIGSFGKESSERTNKAKSIFQTHGIATKDATCAFEGGNILMMHDNNGTPKAVIGEDNVTMTHVLLRKLGFFDQPDIAAELDHAAPAISDINKQKQIEIDEILALLNTSSSTGAVRSEPERSTNTAAEHRSFLAERQYITASLFPKDLALPPEHCVYIPQPQYHIDMMLGGGVTGTLFLHDYSLAGEVLQKISSDPESHNLDNFTLNRLKQYQDVNSQLAQELNPLMSQIKQLLREHDFTVVNVAGVYYDLNGDNNANFINGVCGKGTSGIFYLSPGSQVDRDIYNYDFIGWGGTFNDTDNALSYALMDAFKHQLSPHIDSVYFVGKTDNTGFAEPAAMVSKAKAGLHCITLQKYI